MEKYAVWWREYQAQRGAALQQSQLSDKGIKNINNQWDNSKIGSNNNLKETLTHSQSVRNNSFIYSNNNAMNNDNDDDDNGNLINPIICSSNLNKVLPAKIRSRQDSRLPSVKAFDALIAGKQTKDQFNKDRVEEFGLQKVFISKEKGNGVKNSVIIPKGAIVLIFDGEYINYAEAKRRESWYSQTRTGCYMLYLTATIDLINSSGTRVHLSAIDPTVRHNLSIEEYSLGRYFNDAQSSLTQCNIDLSGKISQDSTCYYIAMKARRLIEKDEELCFDYGDKVSGSLFWRDHMPISNLTTNSHQNMNKSVCINNNKRIQIQTENKDCRIEGNDDVSQDSKHYNNNNTSTSSSSRSEPHFVNSLLSNNNYGSSTQMQVDSTGSSRKSSNKQRKVKKIKDNTKQNRKRKFEERICRKTGASVLYSDVYLDDCCNRFKCCNKLDLFTATALYDCRMALHSLDSAVDQRNLIHHLQRIDHRGASHPTVLNETVCFAFFCFAYQISNNRLTNVRKLGKKQRNVRVAESPREQAILTWLDAFASFHELMPNSKFIQLPYAGRKIVANFFLEDSRNNCSTATSLSYFLKIWRKKRPDIILRKHLRFALCDTCVSLRVKRNATIDANNLETQRKQLREHLEFIKRERQCYMDKRVQAKLTPKECLSMILDGADQSAYGMPHFADITKTTSGAHKQRYHLIGVLVHPKYSYLYTCTDKWPHDSNLTIEVLHRTFLNLERGGTKLPPVLYLQMDNCTRENKNRYLLAYLSWLIMREIFQEIFLSFLPVGHTHTDIDQLFSRTSFALKHNDAPCRTELYKVVQSCYWPMPHTEHIEVTANIRDWFLENNYLNKLEGHTEPAHFKICPSEHNHNNSNNSAHNGIQAVIWTKMRSDDEYWKGDIESFDKDGFALLKSITPLSMRNSDVPDSIPKPCDMVSLNELKKGLGYCKSRLTDAQYHENAQDLEELEKNVPMAFHWTNGGSLESEMKRNCDGNTRNDAHDLAVSEKNSTNKNKRHDAHDVVDIKDESDGFVNLQRGQLMSSKAQNFGEFDIKHLNCGDFVILGADGRDGQHFWVGQVTSVPSNKRDELLSLQWFEANKEFGQYYPSIDVELKQPFTGEIKRDHAYCRFDCLTKSSKIPPRVEKALRTLTQLFE